MKSPRILLTLLLPLLFILAGCSTDETSSSTGNYTFIVHYSGSGWDQMNRWIVLHTLSGDSVLGVQQVTHEGSYDFGAVSSDHVTVTFLDSLGDGWHISSYINTRGGKWKFSHAPASSSLGTVEVTVPRQWGDYTQIRISWPGSTWSGILSPQDTAQTRVLRNVYNLERDNRFSLLVRVSGESGTAFGWLTRQSFQLQQNNSYTVSVYGGYNPRAITTSRPVQILNLRGYRAQSGSWYPLSEAYDRDGRTAFSMPWAGFPVSNWNIEAAYYGQDEQFQFYKAYSQVPAQVEIPSSFVSATFYTPSDYRAVTVNGEADVLWGSWRWITSEGKTSQWTVYCDPASATIRRPVLPSSLRSLVGSDSAAHFSGQIGIINYDDVSGWENYLPALYSLSGDASRTEYGSYSYARAVTADLPLSRAEVSSPLPHTRQFVQ
ncbi:MAG TPA: hypothetical protein VGL38_09675 [bacterium]|jgi:hypothetical protein